MIDPDEDKRLNVVSSIKYIEGHRSLVSKFLRERVRHEDEEFVLKELLRNPVAFAETLKANYETTEDQRRYEVIKKIIKEGNLTVMIGAKGHGKTATAIWLADYVHNNFPDKKICWFGYNPALEKSRPFIIQSYSFLNLPENALLLFDEASIFLYSREAMSRSSRDRIKNLPTVRHRGISVLFISQSAQTVDVGVFLLADFVWFKPYFVSELDQRLNLPPYLKYLLPKNPPENLIHDLNTQINYTFTNPLPKGWNDELSKPFSKIKNKKEARELYTKLIEAKFDESEMRTIFEIRGIDPDEIM